MSKTLDRSRPFGTVHPPYEGAHFEQDGYHFDVEGKLVEALLTVEQKNRLAAQKSKDKAKPPRPPADPPPAGAAPSGSPPPSASEESGDEDENAINLEQWLRDDASANFKDVRSAVKARYGVWETAKAGVVAFLVNEQKLLAAEEIDPELRKLLPKREGE